ncbi:MAG: DUF2461 domain-containing protein [Myxococcaceae bacterium]|nr:DUF2461 domain-containing protein [Myxococcaceae bacterium]MCI0672423.1 DUF2461 domain-containing protein [Myxococcaceae bacterium]
MAFDEALAVRIRGVGFSGFPEGTFKFLRGIAQHNTREWFEDHREDYEQFYVEPAKAFVTALGPRLKKLSKSIHFEPKVNGSIFRINRDVRFSKDKRPYKTHLDLWFWEGEHRGWDAPGFFFRMSADTLTLGAGMHQFGKEALAAYREAVLDSRKGRALAALVDEVKGSGPYEIGGATRKTVPRGFDARHERAGLLLHEGLWAGLEGRIPPEARSERFVDSCEKHFAALAPINRWLLSATH